jgi:O-succinylbenzoic acid--CoA ligase
MKAIIVGGAVNIALQSQIQQLSVPVFSTYGMTETVSHIAIKRLNKESISDKFEILDGVEIKLDERSCLSIKAPASNNEWIFTNDVVELTEDKKFKILGRYDNIINSGGVKIQLEEVEKVVLEICKKYFEELSNKRFFAWGLMIN